MKFYFEKFNNVKNFEANGVGVLNRNTIKRIKRMLVYQKEKYIVLRDKFLG